MEYLANFSANNSTSFQYPISGTNKNELIKAIRATAEAERFQGNKCSWWVFYIDYKTYKTPASICVARGGVDRSGKRYREKLPKNGEIMF